MRPVVTAVGVSTCRGGDLSQFRRPAELGQAGHQRILQQATLRQILDQRRQRLVGRRAQSLDQALVMSLVTVERLATGPDRNQPHTSLDQSTGQQHALAQMRHSAPPNSGDLTAETVPPADRLGLVIQPECLTGFCCGDQIERLFVKDIFSVQGSGRDRLVETTIQLRKQLPPLTKSADPQGLFQSRYAIIPLARISSNERVVGIAEKSGQHPGDEVAAVEEPLGQVNIIGQSPFGRHQLGQHRAIGGGIRRGRAADQLRISQRRLAGQHEIRTGVVIDDAVIDRTDHAEMVHLPGQLRQVFTELIAGDRGVDRLQRPPDILRSLRFHVPHVDLARPPFHEEEDAGLGRRPRRVRRQHLGQGQAQGSQATHLQDFSPPPVHLICSQPSGPTSRFYASPRAPCNWRLSHVGLWPTGLRPRPQGG